MVGVGIPTRDRPTELRLCLQALASQTFQQFRVVVVDNCHRVDLEPLGLEGVLPGRTTFLCGHRGNAPQAHQMCLSYGLIDCDYILRLDDDLELEAHALQEMVSTLDDFPEAVAVGGCWIGNDTRRVIDSGEIEWNEFRQMYPWSDLRLRESPFLHSSWMYRRRNMVDTGGMYGGVEAEFSHVAFREETLASRRLAHLTGKKLLINPRAIAFHHWASGGTRDVENPEALLQRDKLIYKREIARLGISVEFLIDACVPFRPTRGPGDPLGEG